MSFKENIDISNKPSDTKEIQAIRHEHDRLAEAAKGSTLSNPDISNCIKLLSLLEWRKKNHPNS